MNFVNVALIAVLSSIATPLTSAGEMTNNVEWNSDGHSSSIISSGDNGFSTNSCLQELYGDNILTCTGPKFWESISMEAPPSCVMGSSMVIEKLSFVSTFTTTSYDFSVVVYTGTNYDMSSTMAAVNGESCSIQSLTGSNKGTGTGTARIVRDDDDSCWDVVMTGINGDCKITSTILFTETLSIPCTDYGTGDGIVKLQLCSSGRTKDDNLSCDDISGPSPSEPSMCYCETIAIPGVEIIVNGKEPETPSPSTEVVYTPAPNAPIIDLPTLAPITLEPTDSPTKAPVTPTPNTPLVEVVTPGPTPCLDVVANDDSVTTSVDTSVSIPVLINDVPSVPGIELTVTKLLYDGANGKCIISEIDTAVVYLPDSGYFGMDTCVYETCDSEERCDTATISIVVTASDIVPIAYDDYVTTDKDTPVSITPLVNDTAVPGYSLVVKTITIDGTNGTCVVDSKSVIIYIPDSDFLGVDTCVYETCDVRPMCDTAMITITVTGEPGPCDDGEGKADVPTLEPTPLLDIRMINKLPTPKPTSAPVLTPEPTVIGTNEIFEIIPEPTPNPSKKPTKKPTSVPAMDNWVSSAPTPEPTLPDPTPAPVTDEPTDSPTYAPVTSEPTEYPTPQAKELIVPEPTLSPVTPETTLSPGTLAPTPCEYRIWYFTYTALSGGAMGAKLCTNGEYSSSIIGSMTYYDSVDDCCAQNFMSDEDGEECMTIDVCNPPTEYPAPAPVELIIPESTLSPTLSPVTDEPTDSPTKAPVTSEPTEYPTPAPVEVITPEPTYSPVTDEPTLSPITPAPTPCEYRKWYLMYAQLSGGAIGAKKCTNGYANPNQEGFDSMTFYDSVGECCAANMSGGKCMQIDICNPTPPPSDSPTLAPITVLPTFSPTTIEIITYSPVTNEPTLSPVTPAPTPCEYRKWYLMYAQLSGGAIGAKKCTNGYANPNEEGFGSMIFYDSVGECCAANMSGVKCMIHDVCNPTPPPSEFPTPAPVTPAPVELITLEPTYSPVTDEPTLSPVTPAPTPCEYRKWFLIFNELSGGSIGAKKCTNGYSNPDEEGFGSMIFYDSVGECCAATMSGGECMQIDICNPTPPPTPFPPVEVTETPTDIERGSPTLLPTMGPTFAGTPTVGKESESVKLIPREYRKRMLRYMKL